MRLSSNPPPSNKLPGFINGTQSWRPRDPLLFGGLLFIVWQGICAQRRQQDNGCRPQVPSHGCLLYHSCRLRPPPLRPLPGTDTRTWSSPAFWPMGPPIMGPPQEPFSCASDGPGCAPKFSFGTFCASAISQGRFELNVQRSTSNLLKYFLPPSRGV